MIEILSATKYFKRKTSGYIVLSGGHPVHLASLKDAKEFAEKISLKINPIGKGASNPKRPSQRAATYNLHGERVTTKRASPRLVARRKKNIKKGYFPNPSHAKIHDLKFEVMASDKSNTWVTVAVFRQSDEAILYAKNFAKRNPAFSVKVESQ